MPMATTSINQDAILNWAAAQITSMATGLCENCHKTPKFGTHKYCGKTCATQAATVHQPAPRAKPGPHPKAKVPPPAQKPGRLCDYCGQKPKFSNFDYCGKSCASKAATVPPAQPAVHGRSVPKQGVRLPATAQPIKTSKSAMHHAVTKDGSSEDDDDEYADADEEVEDDTGTDLDDYPSDDEEEPTPAPPSRPVKTAHASLKQSTSARHVTGTCLVPNCGKPSFVDRGGVKTDYCSTRHREEAVTLGLVPGCIMCQRYPQTGTDYFCSTACRNQSMTKV
ncbi:hypothetical protein DFJ58DRAFT_808877 [Suillus subalutaceus]|uniref:uncharacterized protein n=1 Tax=Suillus subalutaceus TaxID=48586 RepID=UPI001B86394C|nr:uncharacterized protein DFJ58DRAFT_808877 [Suillus subalutaceus]KAG1841239.1 hypothetical protein DFJ58DRAFT_808877 [Suillus subalutaceus]